MGHFIFHTLALLFIAFLIGLFLGYWLKSVFGARTADVSVPSMPVRTSKTVQLDEHIEKVETPVKAITKKVKKTVVKSAVVEEVAAPMNDADKPAVLKTARGGKADNLKRISGIGPANEKKLNGLGIYHFDQIASWTPKEVDWVNGFLAFPGRIQREDWINQAKLLASGADTDFSKRVDKGEVESSL